MSPRTRWRLSPLELLVAYQHMGRDRLPFPLSFRGDAQTMQEFAEMRRTAAQSVLAQFDDNLHRVLAVLAEPVAQVIACGLDDGQQLIRVRGGVDRTIGTVAEQFPGPDREAGGDVLLSLCRREHLGSRIADALPTAPPGAKRPPPVHRSDLAEDGGAVLRSAGYVSPRSEALRFYRRPHTGTGEVTVADGTWIDGRVAGKGEMFRWIDFVDDGRYLVRGEDPITAVPGSPEALAQQIATMVDAAERSLTLG
ncbi:ESX secretion-associated protein EspG [Rhodococcus triatomae]|uniref:EspG family protein n=1 Tax=Rhodococcus triatomae TaxID=300028 RepID=A0A1G8EWK7_9NOCA|nr:ESX secretion-associated protein EspG [Rhodococcus triatomae]QNG19316.1 ESX secretion-associated protein EspG [Rhodococcus triatomae]QNG24771.1 ESX secretion-associated protein EspG [Rhodococcus triatomae]SDH74248.1 EspG family protein [Rhodococcus triatomae]